MKQIKLWGCFFTALIALFLSAASNATVWGGIDGFIPNTNYLSGWTCRNGSEAQGSPWVEIYAYAPYGQPGAVYLTRVESNIPSNAHCSSLGGNWKVDMTSQLLPPGVTYYAHGRDFYGPGGYILSNSGKSYLPSGPIKGNIDGVFQLGNGNYVVQGWACDYGVQSSTSVHVYVGGAAGSGGTMITSGTANLPSEPAVGAACYEGTLPHRFSIDITAWRAQFAGAGIYIHGISHNGGSNLLIGNSGSYVMPIVQAPNPTCSLTVNSTFIPKGQPVTFILGSANLPINTTAYWMGSSDGVTISPQAIGANSGSFSFVNSTPAQHLRYAQFKNGSGAVICTTSQFNITFQP